MRKLKRKIVSGRLEKKDLDRTVIRVLSRAAWEKKKAGAVRERIHVSRKLKPPRHKKPSDEFEDS